MSNKKRSEMSMFINSRGRIDYNRLCKACLHDCKQSYRAIIFDCPTHATPKEIRGLKNFFGKLDIHP